jgi:hypothetical protein
MGWLSRGGWLPHGGGLRRGVGCDVGWAAAWGLTAGLAILVTHSAAKEAIRYQWSGKRQRASILPG